MRLACELESPGHNGVLTAWRPDIPYHPEFTYYHQNSGRHRYFTADPGTGVLSENRARSFDEHRPAGYISTWIEAGRGREILRYIDVDLDVSRVNRRWLAEDNSEIDAGKLTEFLRAQSWFFKNIAYLIRSKSGGIHIVLAISPCVINEESNTWKMLNRLQQVIYKFLTLCELNPDPGALGLKRLVPNFRDGRKILYANSELISSLQQKRLNDTGLASGNRPVARAMLRAAYRAIRRVKKNRLYSDNRVEKKLSRLFLDIYAERKRNEVLRATSRELAEEYRLSPEFIHRQILAFTQAGYNEKLPWLSLSYCGDGVWELSLKGDSRVFLKRARQVVSGHLEALPDIQISSRNSSGRMKNLDLRAPEEIQAGERHKWLVDNVLLCKMGLGLCEQEALARVAAAAARVPDFHTSRSIRRLSRIVHSIYRRREDLLGCLAGRLSIPEHLTTTRRNPFSDASKKFSYSNNIFFHSAKCDTNEPAELVLGSPVPSGSEILTETVQTLFLGSPERGCKGDGKLALLRPPQPEPPKLAVVRHHNRVGIFHQNELLLLTTSSRNFSAAAALKHIRTLGKPLSHATFWYPKVCDQRRREWVAAMQNPEAVVIPAAVICGRSPTRIEKISQWCEIRRDSHC